MLLWAYVYKYLSPYFQFWGDICRSGIAGSYGNSMFIFFFFFKYKDRMVILGSRATCEATWAAP